MLILTRKSGESLMIGEDISVTVLGVKGNQVRIGINAPKDIAVHREEIFDKFENTERVAIRISQSKIKKSKINNHSRS